MARFFWDSIVLTSQSVPSPRQSLKNGFIKQYVRDKSNLRTEPATNNVKDYDVGKAIDNLPVLREKTLRH